MMISLISLILLLKFGEHWGDISGCAPSAREIVLEQDYADYTD